MKRFIPALLLSLAMTFSASSAFAQSFEYDNTVWGWTIIEAMYDSSAGIGTDSCLTCDLSGYFSSTLHQISLVIFDIFRSSALMLFSGIAMIYLTFQVGVDLLRGDVRPRDFIFTKLPTLVMTTIIGLLLLGNTIFGFGTGSTTLHTLTGPTFLNATFQFTSEIRNDIGDELVTLQRDDISFPREMFYKVPDDKVAMYTVARQMHVAKTSEFEARGYTNDMAAELALAHTSRQYPEYDAIRIKLMERNILMDRVNKALNEVQKNQYGNLLGCGNINLDSANSYARTGLANNNVEGHQFTESSIKYIEGAAAQACFVERVHLIGIATGLSVLFADNHAGDSVNTHGGPFIDMLFQLVVGLVLIYIFGFSLVYYLFLVFDMMVRAMITAAFSPVLILFLFFPTTRPLFKQAMLGLIGILGTAVALSVSGGIGLVLFFKTIDLYNSYAQTAGPYADLMKLPIGASLTGYKDFLAATLGAMPGMPRVPLTISAPWTIYLMLTGLLVNSIGKTIITIVESILGTVGQDTMATTALSTAKSSLALAKQGGQMMVISTMAAGKSAGRGGGNMIGKGYRSLFPGQEVNIENVSGNAAQRVFDGTFDKGLSDAPAAQKSIDMINGGGK